MNQHCCKWRNDSVYDSRGEFILKIGNKDLKNFRFSMWIEASDDLDLPCDNLKFWINRERQFAVEIPHFPKGSVYKNTATILLHLQIRKVNLLLSTSLVDTVGL